MTEEDLRVAALRFHIDHPSSSHHMWGDDWEYWSDLDKAIRELDGHFRSARVLAYTKEKYGSYRATVLSVYDGRLKSLLQPSVRLDFYWWYSGASLYKLRKRRDNNPSNRWYRITGFCADVCKRVLDGFIQPCVNWLLGNISVLDRFIARPHLPFYSEFHLRKEDYKHPFLHRVDEWIKGHIRFIPKSFVCWVVSKQIHRVNEGFQKVCLKYPHIVHELISEIDCYKWIIPYGKYIVDGEKIHNMHWKSL